MLIDIYKKERCQDSSKVNKIVSRVETYVAKWRNKQKASGKLSYRTDKFECIFMFHTIKEVDKLIRKLEKIKEGMIKKEDRLKKKGPKPLK